MNDFIPALIASAISATAALGGVALANRSQQSRHREVLREDAVALQRELIAQVLLAGRSWQRQAFILVVVLGKASTDEMVELAGTDVVERAGTLLAELDGAATRAALATSDSQVQKVVSAIADFIHAFGEEILAPVVNSSGSAGRSEAMASASAQLREFGEELNQLQSLTTSRLALPSWHNSRD